MVELPLDICTALIEFDKQYSAKLLGTHWRRYLFDSFNEFNILILKEFSFCLYGYSSAPSNTAGAWLGAKP